VGPAQNKEQAVATINNGLIEKLPDRQRQTLNMLSSASSNFC